MSPCTSLMRMRDCVSGSIRRIAEVLSLTNRDGDSSDDRAFSRRATGASLVMRNCRFRCVMFA